MKVSLKWLNQYVKIDDVDPYELAEKITLHGVEVDAVGPISDAVGVVVGYVVERKQHPDADRLSVCQVDLGSEDGVVQIVCGAPNVDAGQKVAVAKNKAILPGNFKIKKSKIRGQESNGMICSLTELGVDKSLIPAHEVDGIMVLPTDAPIGENAIAYLGLDDIVLELGLTPNRMDCLSMYGVAYEVAAILDRELVLETPALPAVESSANELVKITLQTDNVSQYLAQVIKNIKIAPSPLCLQAGLIAAGVRPINNVVDITNYVMLATGQPLHAFDYDKLVAKDIVVRQAKDGEVITTLDEKECTLMADDVLICAGDQPVAIAGVRRR